MNKTYIVIGTSAAGLNALVQLRKLDPNAHLIGITQEQEFPYNKCLLVDFIAGQKSESALFLRSLAWLAQENIQLRFNTTVINLIPTEKKVVLADGKALFYDKLLIASGSQPFICPQLRGYFNNVPNLIPFHSLADAYQINRLLSTPLSDPVVIIGAGINGLECAEALRKRNIQTIMVEQKERILWNMYDPQASQLIQDHLMQKGIRFLTNTSPIEIIIKDNLAREIQLDNGQTIKTSFIILATGVVPHTQFAQALPQEKGRIVVNEHLKTVDAFIFAAGDCAIIKNSLNQTFMGNRWPDAVLQGITAASNMIDQPRPFPCLPPFTQSQLGDWSICFGGDLLFPNARVHHSISKKTYEKNLLDGAYNLQGFVLIGKIERGMILRKALFTKMVL
ncbi:MAG: FAD-dependent oxidoreductase [Candidatus Babeliaceae bacterium]